MFRIIMLLTITFSVFFNQAIATPLEPWEKGDMKISLLKDIEVVKPTRFEAGVDDNIKILRIQLNDLTIKLVNSSINNQDKISFTLLSNQCIFAAKEVLQSSNKVLLLQIPKEMKLVKSKRDDAYYYKFKNQPDMAKASCGAIETSANK